MSRVNADVPLPSRGTPQRWNHTRRCGGPLTKYALEAEEGEWGRKPRKGACRMTGDSGGAHTAPQGETASKKEHGEIFPL